MGLQHPIFVKNQGDGVTVIPVSDSPGRQCVLMSAADDIASALILPLSARGSRARWPYLMIPIQGDEGEKGSERIEHEREREREGTNLDKERLGGGENVVL